MSTKPYARFAAIALLVLSSLLGIAFLSSSAQQPSGRIARSINNGARITLSGTRAPRLQNATDLGRMNASTRLHGISLAFSRTASQEVALQKLIAEQQNSASPLYHKWLTPDEFGARFGLATSDLAKVQMWLQQQGFKINSIARSRNSIRFSGTAGQVQAAFGAEMHNYRVGSKTHFAPARDISVPAALAPVVLGVRNLSTFSRPRSHLRKPPARFTSSQSGNHFLTPKDVATIYDINNPDINAAAATGFNGAGQAIAVVGQSSVALSDIENFQTALGITVKDPTLVLVPDSGNVEEFSGDEAESNLDLEYSSGVATGATVYFVYTGDDPTQNVWNSIQFAIDTDIAPIISTSYGICETALRSDAYSTINQWLSQAAAQGQTIVAAAGDQGSTDCSGVSGLSTAQQQALAVDFPASSQYVTGMGGSEFPTADVCAVSTTCTTSSQYWQATSGADVIGSALSYMPNEGVWNDDASSGISSGGGGISALTARQSWQTGSAFPSGSFRLVPDISLSASNSNAPFLFCSSDVGFTGVTGSCSNNTFRDSNGQSLTGGGGTSFDAPIFAALVALINQKENATGQGSVNSTLYSLAANSTTYGSAFHDITAGGNQCSAGASLCTGSATTKYVAGTGYDEASGLGSIDFASLLSAWPASCPSCSSKAASRTTLSAASAAPAVGSTDAITITVAPISTSSPGTLTLLVDGAAVTPAPTLTSGTATYPFTPSSTGSHTITATYSGDPTYAPSTGTVVVDNQAFRATATNVSVTAGSSGSSTVTITPQEGYTGTIQWTVTSSSNVANTCYSISNSTVSDANPVTATLSINTSSSQCASGSLLPPTGPGSQSKIELASANSHRVLHSAAGALTLAMGLLFAGVLMAGPVNRRKLWIIAGVFILLTISLVGVGCGSSPSSVVPTPNNSGNATPGTYNLTVTGTDTSNPSLGATATLTLTVN